MDREGNYLRIPWDYSCWLGGLCWSRAGDAVEYGKGGTFVLSPQIALFLEGFAESGRVPHFGHVLHLLHLLGHGQLERAGPARLLAEDYAAAAGGLRNAGALCAFLCRDFPPLAATPDLKQVCGLLWNAPLMAELCLLWSARPGDVGEAAPLGPSAFEARFLQALGELPREEWQHWLRHGCGTVREPADRLAREIPTARPRTLAQILTDLAERDRLAGAVPFVSQLVGALALPPRRLAHQELPVGGYADVSTRGHPEQLLPSQFAVEDLEFVRRFAENELLYFRREEPSVQVREELLLLLDQGVRTWGTVRLVLAAAVLAFGKLAERRKVPLLLAGTSSKEEPLRAAEADEASLGKLLEASDLTPQPGAALERVLEERTDVARDVVLLTHPRSLREADVTAAARRVRPGTRLFALAVDDQGRAQLAELRHGTPVKINEFRIDLSRAAPKPPPAVKTVPASTWKGPVEPVGFPFRLGITTQIERFAFDAEGAFLLTVSRHGMLHAWGMQGSRAEVLPRPVSDGQVLKEVEAVVGVADGFVVVFKSRDHLRVFHYDFARETCASLPFKLKFGGAWQWHYFPRYHAVVAVIGGSHCQGVDLATGEFIDLATVETEKPEHASVNLAPRLRIACEEAVYTLVPQPEVSVTTSGRFDDLCCAQVALDPKSGTIEYAPPKKQSLDSLTPLADGRPVLMGAKILRAQFGGEILALLLEPKEKAGRTVLRLFRLPDGAPVTEFWHYSPAYGFQLSRDGRRLARQISETQVMVQEVAHPSAFVFVTTKGKCHQDLQVELGNRMVLAQVGNWLQLIRWDRDRLEISQGQGDPIAFLLKHVNQLPDNSGRWSRSLAQVTCRTLDPDRFHTSLKHDVVVAVDVYGQLAVFDHDGNLICMFFIFRGQTAAWLPDGTRYGPASITGGPATADAAEKIGKALKAASERGEEWARTRVLHAVGSRVPGRVP